MISKMEYSNHLQSLARRPEFNQFSEDSMALLAQRMHVNEFPKGQVLFDQGDDRERFYFLERGLIRTDRLDETGRFEFYSYIKRSQGFPYEGLFKASDYACAAKAMTNVTVVSFDMLDFEEQLRQNPDAMIWVISKMSGMLIETEARLQKMVTKSAVDRVKNALMFLSEQIGETMVDGRILIPYPITLIELAQVSGTTRETASQTVHQLIRQGDITYAHKNITLVRPL